MLELRRSGLKFGKEFTSKIGAVSQQASRHMTVEHNTGSRRASCYS